MEIEFALLSSPIIYDTVLRESYCCKNGLVDLITLGTRKIKGVPTFKWWWGITTVKNKAMKWRDCWH